MEERGCVGSRFLATRKRKRRRRGGRFRSSANPDANHHPVAGQGRDTGD
jgi:hypothetical protein